MCWPYIALFCFQGKKSNIERSLYCQSSSYKNPNNVLIQLIEIAAKAWNSIPSVPYSPIIVQKPLKKH